MHFWQRRSISYQFVSNLCRKQLFGQARRTLYQTHSVQHWRVQCNVTHVLSKCWHIWYLQFVMSFFNFWKLEEAYTYFSSFCIFFFLRNLTCNIDVTLSLNHNQIAMSFPRFLLFQISTISLLEGEQYSNNFSVAFPSLLKSHSDRESLEIYLTAIIKFKIQPFFSKSGW